MDSPRRVNPESARIVEIGCGGLFKEAFPDRTRLLWTYHKLVEPVSFYEPFSLRAALDVWREIRKGNVDLIVAWVSPYPPWNFRQFKAVLSRPFHPLNSLIRIFGVQALRLLRTSTPIIVIDNEDPRTIAAHNVFLLDKAKLFFKRELPVDRWQAFQHTVHAGMPGARFRAKPKNRARIAKLRPITIGVNAAASAQMPFPDKSTDLFVAITLEGGTTVRNQGMEQLLRLARGGVRIDIAERRLGHAEYVERMARAWLTWSPEGLGWDCFRHYEAPLAYSVPVINRPTIVRYAPLIDGVHAFYYDPDEPEGLANRIRAALGDKDALRQIAGAARAHVLAHHVRPHPLADALLRMGLGLEEAPGGLALAPMRLRKR
jgi:hypothetical protein